MDSRIPSTMEQIEEVKTPCAKPKKDDLVWLNDHSKKRCEKIMRQIFEIFTGNDTFERSARDKMAHGEVNWPVVKLESVFYDGVSEIENRAGDVGATSIQPKEP